MKWAVGQGMIPACNHEVLKYLASLKRGRRDAPETEPIFLAEVEDFYRYPAVLYFHLEKPKLRPITSYSSLYSPSIAHSSVRNPMLTRIWFLVAALLAGAR